MVDTKTKIKDISQGKIRNPLTGRLEVSEGTIRNPLTQKPKMKGDVDSKSTKVVNKILGK